MTSLAPLPDSRLSPEVTPSVQPAVTSRAPCLRGSDAKLANYNLVTIILPRPGPLLHPRLNDLSIRGARNNIYYQTLLLTIKVFGTSLYKYGTSFRTGT